MRAPVLATLFLIVTLALLAIPGSANFVGEFYILNGVFQEKIVLALVAIDRRSRWPPSTRCACTSATMHNRLPRGRRRRREITAARGRDRRAAGRLHRRAWRSTRA